MDCSACGTTNREGARFCDSCGAPLVATPPTAGPTAPTEEARKVVTIVFADLAGSTPLHERLDAESVRRLMDRYYAAMRAAVEAHQGTVVKLLGDGVMAAFGVPQVKEDDAVRAVRAAHAMQQAFAALAASMPDLGDFGLRVGVNTGEVVVAAGNDDVVGDPVNVAARLQQYASLGDVLVGDATRRLVRAHVTLDAAGDLTLKGRAGTVAGYRLASLERPIGGRITPLVGRDAELRRLLNLFDDTVAAGAAHLAVIVGSPGLGKSRLLAELESRLSNYATVYSAHCDAAGASTFAPLADALRNVPEAAELFDAGRSPQETFAAVRRVLAGLASERPVVLVIDDVHWAEPLLLDLLEHLVEWTRDAPLYVIASARPELRDARARLVSRGGLVAELIALDGLDPGAATRLAADVLGADELPAAVAGRVLAASEGNPLFVGELVRMMVDDGVLQRDADGDRWVASAELADLEVPPTIHALLAARLERLRPEHRAVAERAAVIGRTFSRAAVAHLVPDEVAAHLDDHLAALRRAELVEPDESSFLGDTVLRFHHALIQDAAYRRLLKGVRAELHERFADWLLDQNADTDDTDEHDEVLGWHLEQAYQHLGELGSLDEHGRSLGRRSATHLAAAGRRALERDDLAAAASLLGRAIDCLEPGAPERGDLLLERCEALLAAGDVAVARAALTVLDLAAIGDDRLAAWHTAFAGQLAVLTEPDRLRDIVADVAVAAEQLTALGDVSGQAKAHSVHALALARLGQIAECEAALDRALAAARSAGDRRRANAVLAGAPQAALWGPSPITRASGRCLDVVRVLRITTGAPAVEAVALRCQAVLEALRGRADAARRMVGSARRTVEELGLTHRLLETEMFAGLIELLDGDAEAAESHLRPAYDGLRSRGLGIDAAQAAAWLARAVLLQGRHEDAIELSRASELLAGDDLKAGIAWRGVRAEALAFQGDDATAVELAREAVAMASPTDALLDHADARVALATALRLAGDTTADEEAARAAGLYEAKGATLLVERLRDEPVVVSEPAPPTMPAADEVKPNAATRHREQFAAAWERRDLDAVLALVAPTYRMVDRRPMIRAEFDYEHAVDNVRRIFERVTHVERTRETLATRGERLDLRFVHTQVAPNDDAHGPAELTYLQLLRVDEDGRRDLTINFDVDDLDAALTELDRLHAEALEAAEMPSNFATRSREAMQEPWEARDWERWSTHIAPDMRLVDRRPLVAGELDRDAAMATYRLVFDSTPERSNAHDVLEVRGGFLELNRVTLQLADGESDVSKIDLYQVMRVDELGRRNLSVAFSFDQLDEARAELDRLYAEERATAVTETAHANAPVPPLAENLATHSFGAFQRAFNAGDVETLRTLFAADWEMEDRRSYAHTRLTIDEFIDLQAANLRRMSPTRWDIEVLATRGTRLALLRGHWTGSVHTIGDSEFDMLLIGETDEHGVSRYAVGFDADAFEAAVAELDERYVAGEAGPHRDVWRSVSELSRLVDARDVDGMRAVLPDNFVAIDRKATRLGTLDRDGFITYVAEMKRLAPRAREWVRRVVGLHAFGAIGVSTREGTLDGGGPFSGEYVNVALVDAQRRCVSLSTFDIEELDLALEEFEAARAEPAAFEVANLATRLLDEYNALISAREIDRAMAMLSSSFRIYDLRAGVQFDASPEETRATFDLVHGLESIAIDYRLVATRGKYLSLHRQTVRIHDRSVGESIQERFVLFEVDGEPHFVGAWYFDLDDIDGAFDELEARYTGDDWSGAPTTLRQATRDGDWERLSELFTPDFAVHDHRGARGLGDFTGREAYFESLRVIRDLAPNFRGVMNHIIDLSPFAGLVTVAVLADVDGASSETHSFLVIRRDETGRFTEWDVYRLDQYAQARARYDELTGSVPAQTMASRGVEEFFAAFAARDWDRLSALQAPRFVLHDRRKLLGVDQDPETAAAGLRLIFDEPGARWEHTTIATRGDRLVLYREKVAAPAGDDEGSWAAENYDIAVFDERGLRVESWLFDIDDLDAAYAKLDELSAEGEGATDAPPPFANAATRSIDEFLRAFRAGDWDAVARTHAPEFHLVDRRRRIDVELGADDALTELRAMFSTSGVQYEFDHLATRGEFLALDRVRVRSQGVHAVEATGADPSVADAGDIDYELLTVIEASAAGQRTTTYLLDGDDLGAAYDLLDDLFRAGEGRVTPRGEVFGLLELRPAFAARDWSAFESLFASDQIVDHRVVATFDPPTSGSDVTAGMRALTALAPDARFWIEHVLAVDANRILFCGRVDGTMEGGPFDLGVVVAAEYDANRSGLRSDTYDLDALDLARARYEEMAAPPRTNGAAAFSETERHRRERANPLANSATRFTDESRRRWDAGDWDGFVAMWRPDARVIEHEETTIGPQGRDEQLAGLRMLFDAAWSEVAFEVLAARGDRLCLGRQRLTWRDDTAGISELHYLLVVEVDEDGLLREFARFADDDLDGAFDDLDDRFAEGEGALQPGLTRYLKLMRHAHRDQDWDLMRSMFRPDVVVEDHRRVGVAVGDSSSVDKAVALMESMIEVAPETRYFITGVPALEANRVLALSIEASGTDLTDFSLGLASVSHVDADGRAGRVDLYGVDQLDDAWARYDAIGTQPFVPRANESSFANTVTRVVERQTEAWSARDWDALVAPHPSDHVLHDMRRFAQEDFVGEESFVWLRSLFDVDGAAQTFTSIATRGDRLALFRTEFTLAGEVVGDGLMVAEIDHTGVRTQTWTFDMDDLDRAHDVLDERYAAGEAAAHAADVGLVTRLRHAYRDRDANASARLFAADAVIHDHRSGHDLVLTREEWGAGTRYIVERAPDAQMWIDHVLALDAGKMLVTARTQGTVDGAAFELRFAHAFTHHDGAGREIHAFDIDDLDAAWATYHQLPSP